MKKVDDQGRGIKNIVEHGILFRDQLKFDEYDDLYDEISGYLNGLDEVPHEELFNDCLKYCEQIFKIAEVDYGKQAKNLPYDYIHDVSFLYDSIRCQQSMPKKYGAETTYEDYKTEKISLSDYGNLISEKNHHHGAVKRDELEKIKKDHLQSFFGVIYSKELSNEEKYEIIRLTKILYDCKEKMGVDLAYLKRTYFFRFKSQFPSIYQKAIIFIKRKTARRLLFKEVIQLEHLNSTLRNCVKILSDGIVAHEIQSFSNVNCAVYRQLRKEICTVINENLIKINNDKIKRDSGGNIPIDIKAYLNFITLGIEDELSSFALGENIEWMNIDEKVYRFADFFRGYPLNDNVNKDLNEDIASFVNEYKVELAKFITQKDTAEKHDVSRISRSCSDYGLMAYIYNFGMNKKLNRPLSKRELLLLIYLYERCKAERVTISLDHGFYRKKDRKQLTIHELLKKLGECNRDQTNNFLEGKEDYGYAIYWLIDKMYMIMTYRNPVIDSLERELKRNLVIFWGNNIFPFDNGTGQYKTIDDIASVLINKQDLELIKKNILNFMKTASL